MANVGLKMVKVALLDDNDQIIKDEAGLDPSGILALDDRFFGSTQANLSNLEGSVVKISGNNIVQDSYVNPAAPTAAITVNNLSQDILNKMLGNESDGAGGYVFSGVKPRLALLIETETIDRKNSIYFAFGRSQVSRATVNITTDTDTAITRQADALTFTALGVMRWNDGQPYKSFYDGDDGFDEEAMLADVFQGYGGEATTTTTAIN